ncbi:MAG: glycosyltransferase family 10 [Pedobacter sp.]|nr:glycosyltransferase family 10 [Pedobacter sp.]MDQ8053952.1 glycosyltransferase family 10 [Pedobacter sp.]
MPKQIKLKCQNGLSFKHVVADVLADLDEFEFIESEHPDFIIFGPYGDDLPPPGDYVRIGYFCENITPDLDICEYAFGIPSEREINDPKYKRIQWHGLNPNSLIKNLSDNDIDEIISQKTKFCNFLYSNTVAYREDFFRQLSKYKKIDAPGRSMNNMPSIDTLYQGDIWDRKRAFLKEYKFTIAFENYAYPGYQTEKLYDAMLVNSLPIYCGDANIQEIFNPKSFLNARDYVAITNNGLIKFLERVSQQDFTDYRPQFKTSLAQKAIRKFKTMGRAIKMKYEFNHLDFSPLIDRIIEIDRNEDLYISYLKQPWFNNNEVSSKLKTRDQWMKIFNS